MQQNFTAALTGRVNNEGIELFGDGAVDSAIGRTHGDYRLATMPPRFDPLLLGACLVTGYPSVCKSSDLLRNPFDGHPYHYDRTIDFGDAGLLSLQTRVHYENGKLRSSFELEGDISPPLLGAIEPIIETWQPGENYILGQFTIAWRNPAGGLFIGDARTKYFIDADVPPIDRLLHRAISLTAEHEPGTGVLTLLQDSSLFH